MFILNFNSCLLIYKIISYNINYLEITGYRCFKAIMFLTGCVFGTSVVYYICTQDAILPQYAIVGE